MKRPEEITLSDGSTITYAQMIARVQVFMSRQYFEELAGEPDRVLLKKQIARYLSGEGINAGCDTRGFDLAGALYDDMAGYSFISDYIDLPGFQELNINAWNSANIIIDSRKYNIEDTFISPVHAVDVVRRIVMKAGGILDNSSPFIVSNISASTRIAAAIYPVIPSETGIYASIRTVNKRKITKDELIKSEVVTSEILEFLKFCIKYKTSVCIAGETFSGKTTLEGYLLSYMAYELKKRIITIEEGSRQLDLIRSGEDGRPADDVLSFLTRRSENPKQDVGQEDLLQLNMKFHPDLICVDEMVSGEAYTTMTAANRTRRNHLGTLKQRRGDLFGNSYSGSENIG